MMGSRVRDRTRQSRHATQKVYGGRPSMGLTDDIHEYSSAFEHVLPSNAGFSAVEWGILVDE